MKKIVINIPEGYSFKVVETATKLEITVVEVGEGMAPPSPYGVRVGKLPPTHRYGVMKVRRFQKDSKPRIKPPRGTGGTGPRRK